MKKNKPGSVNNPFTENETRKKCLTLAKELGCESDLIKIFNRYDKLLTGCTQDVERHQIAVMANVEVHKLFNFINPLIIRGEEILPGDDTSWKE